MRFAIILGLAFAAVGQPATVPFGTELQVRLTTEVSSQKPGVQQISGVIIAPVFVNGAPAISAGTQVSGNTAEALAAQPATDQQPEQVATLKLQFTRISSQTGHSQILYCVVEGVDNARESVDANGLITGITASQTFSARLDQGINKLSSQFAQFAQILQGVKSAIVKEPDAAIDYHPGVELMLKVTRAFNWDALAGTIRVGVITPANQLSNLVSVQPFRTIAQRPPEPSDMTNIMLIGTEPQIQAAFQHAGWFAADLLSPNSKLETARAIIENRGYSEAPMSILYLNGRPPDIPLQKQNDTFAMRHHIRIWRMPQTWRGKPVWVAAATHDISITFSPESRSFTHAIDPNIDAERSKVVNDLLFTGQVNGIALVPRNGIPENASNATGDRLITDGSMAVLEF